MKQLIHSIRFKFAVIFIGILSIASWVSFPVSIHFLKIIKGIPEIIMLALILCFLFGSVLMALAVSIITKPLKQLTDATKKVAKGDFNVRVDYKSKDELGVLINNFNGMAEELSNMELLRADFLSSVSHEFKTPISSIQGFAKLLKKEGIAPADFKNYLDIIEEDALRLSTLSSNILRLSSIENQAIFAPPVKFSLDEQIRKTVLLFTNHWEEKNLNMDIQLDPMDFVGDEELIQQIWTNLIENAIKFSQPNGTISIYLRQVDDNVIVTVADDGIGIPKEKQAHIFNKFYQADSSHATKGNGLGLSIVKSIINRVGGVIEVKSEEGEGSVFTVQLNQNSASDII